jgi:hypothetical protein
MGYSIFWSPTTWRMAKFALQNEKKIIAMYNELNKDKFTWRLRAVHGELRTELMIYGNLNPSSVIFFAAQIITGDNDTGRTYSDKKISKNIHNAGRVFKKVIRDMGGVGEEFRGRSS